MDRVTIQKLEDSIIEAVQLGQYQKVRDLLATALARAESHDEFQVLYEKQKELNEELATKLKELQIPPLSNALVISPSPDDPKSIIVGTGGQRYEVLIAANEAEGEPVIEPHNVVPGSEAWLNEDRQVIKIRPPVSGGEAAEITAVLDDGRLQVQGRGNEELIIERLDATCPGEVQIGDRVRFNPNLGIALEKLPPVENKQLELEAVPDVTYEQIGGLDEQIEEIRDAIELPYLYHRLFDRYHLKRPKGILLYGPPGCGKTMVAKAVANSLAGEITRNLEGISEALRLLQHLRSSGVSEALVTDFTAWQGRFQGPSPEDESAPPPAQIEAGLVQFLDSRAVDSEGNLGAAIEATQERLAAPNRAYFISIKGPELLNKYVGETEHSIRKLFMQAKRRASAATPVVMFFDEIEALFRRRGSRLSSDVESTIVPQFLSEIDGVEEMRDVVIIGATNRQDLLDPAILRPGRLDVKIKIDRPGREAARMIFTKYLLPALPYAETEIDDDGLAATLDRLISRATDLLFAQHTTYRAAGQKVEGGAKTFRCYEFVSGAMIESIVSRVKRRAVKREINEGASGICWSDITASIGEELEQNKDALVATALNLSEEELTVEVVLDEAAASVEINPWLQPIQRPWLHRRDRVVL